ncbi:MAG: PAS domain S-box protein [Anaerolineae bacterium]|nr:PAS domain S-box protein [Anaerolineae bacterium]
MVPVWQDQDTWLVAAGVLSLVVPFSLNRRGRLRAAALATVFIGSVIILLVSYPDTSRYGLNSLYFLPVMVLFSSVFLDHRLTVAVAALQIVAVSSLPLAYGPVVSTLDVVYALGVMVWSSAIILLLTFFRDVFEQQQHAQLQENEQRYRSMFESQVHAVAIHDGTRFLLANDATARLCGYQQGSELVGVPLAAVIHPNWHTQTLHWARERLTGEGHPPQRYELCLLGADGVTRWADTEHVVMQLDGQQVTMTHAMDITERKQAAILLHQQRDHLDALHQTTLDLMRQQDLDSLLETILRRAAELIGTSDGYIYLLEPDQDLLVRRTSLGVFNRYRQMTLHRHEGLAGKVLETGNAMMIDHYDQWEGRLPRFETGIFSSIIGVPLKTRGQTVGVIALAYPSPDQHFLPAQLEILQRFAQFASLAYENARLVRELQRSEKRNRAMLEAMPDLVLRMNQAGVYLDIKPGDPAEAFELPLNAVGRAVHEVLPPEGAAQAQQAITDALHTAQTQIIEYQSKVAGQPQDYEARVIQTKEDEVVVFVRNITERKQAQQQALDLQLEKARVRMLEEFISDASHDLRTPLSNIRSRLYLLQKASDNLQRARQSSVIELEVLRLETLITDLLTMVQLDRGETHPDRSLVNLNHLLQDVVTAHQARADEKALRLQVSLAEQLPPILGSATQLYRVFSNLLTNALNYTEHGTISLRSQAHGAQVMVEVEDTGIGITAEDLPHIFDRFFRADRARSAHSGGTGLGLAIVKRIIELHDGQVIVHSQPQQGARFQVWLPISQHHSQPAQPTRNAHV